MTQWIIAPGINPADFAGFVYLITAPSGRRYIGRKYLESRRRRNVKTKPGAKSARKTQVVRAQSDWQTYWGSCAELLAEIALLGEDKFTREILHWCRTRGETNYREAEEQFSRRVLTARLPNGSRAYFNGNILCKFYAPDA
ncbi:NAD synthetase [Teichococcus deserti]|uniref:NAD synthetase n=1 Tax=Teichococcus deserti TaxID=1817963 RepID=UPI001055ECE9|nr:NAD synthetase [Pseudoroseomonas deserti]